MTGIDILVVPTCRIAHMREFLSVWKGVGTWDAKVIVEDGPSLSGGLRLSADDRHVCWADIDKEVCPGLFSKRDGGIQTFGWLVAARMGADRIHALNDDCLPWSGPDPDPCKAHRHNLLGHIQRWRSSLPDQRTRGVPYTSLYHGRTLDVGLSMGLWAGVPDLDAVTTLAHGAPTDYHPPPGVRVVGYGQYEPFCNMNFAVRRDMLPLLYSPPMGEGQPGGRFDDIWAGLVAKKGFDHLGVLMTVGNPHILHARASNTYRNLQREAGFMEAHEHLWKVIDDIALSDEQTPQGVAHRIARGLVDAAPSFPVESMCEYVQNYGYSLERWANIVAAL